MTIDLDALIEETRPDVNPRVRRMIRRYHGQVVPFRDLPRPAQLAMAFYMAVDGEAWEVPDEVAYGERLTGTAFMERFARILPFFVAKYGDVPFGFVQIPMKALVASISKDSSHPGGSTLVEDHGSFEAYHRWYVSDKRQPVHPPTDPWPVILNTEMDWETLQDGWHRFHRYYDLGLATVPAIYYPDESERT